MTTTTNNNNNVTLLPTPLNPALPGHVISVSCNVIMALSLLEEYMNSTYSLQAADTQLEAAISNQETALVNSFETQQNSPGGYLYMLEHCNPADPNYSTEVSQFSGEYSAANAQNQARTKVMDGNNSVAQNTLSQNSQGQQGITTTMSSINSVAGNLVLIVQG
jgi:hypothetical protein